MPFLLNSEWQVVTDVLSLKVLQLWGPLVLSVNNRTKQLKEKRSVVNQTARFIKKKCKTCCYVRCLKFEVCTSLSLRILVFWVVRLSRGLSDFRRFDGTYRLFLSFSMSQNSRTRQCQTCYCIRYWCWCFFVQEN
jgi:hypothetical protein